MNHIFFYMNKKQTIQNIVVHKIHSSNETLIDTIKSDLNKFAILQSVVCDKVEDCLEDSKTSLDEISNISVRIKRARQIHDEFQKQIISFE